MLAKLSCYKGIAVAHTFLTASRFTVFLYVILLLLLFDTSNTLYTPFLFILYQIIPYLSLRVESLTNESLRVESLTNESLKVESLTVA